MPQTCKKTVARRDAIKPSAGGRHQYSSRLVANELPAQWWAAQALQCCSEETDFDRDGWCCEAPVASGLMSWNKKRRKTKSITSLYMCAADADAAVS
jgi:hypothetical protein